MATTWFTATLLALAMALVAIGPSYYWLRAVRVPSYIAGVFAPAVTATTLVLLGYVYDILGIFWSGARVIPTLAVIGALGAGLFFMRRRSDSVFDALGRRAPAWPPYFWIALIIGWVIAVTPIMFSAPAINPVQQWDPSFHMNGVWTINHVGSGRYGQALAENFTAGQATGYPLGWHIFVALFSVPTTVVFTANAATLAISLLWVAGAAAYTRVLFPVRGAWVIAPIIAGGMLSMPADALAAYSQWPNAAAVALLPGIASFMVVMGRRVYARWQRLEPMPSLRGLFLWILILLYALLGSIIVHPSLAFNLLVLLLPAALAGAYKLWRGDLRLGRWWGIVVLPLVVLLGFYLLVRILDSDAVRSMGDYPRGGVSLQVAFGNFLTPAPPYPRTITLVIWVALVALLMVGGLMAILGGRPGARMSIAPVGRGLRLWPLWSFLAFAALTFIAYGPDSAFREFIVAPWYLDARRIMEPQNLTMVPLAALGFVWVLRQIEAWIADEDWRVPRRVLAWGLTALLLLVSVGEGFPARLGAAQTVYDPNLLGKPGMATAEELEMLRTLDGILEPGAKVLGDPQNGSVYVQMIGQRRAFFPLLTLSRSPSDNETIFVNQFNQIHTNPAVCEAVREEGIKYFYADEDGYYYSRLRSDRTPGLYNVDTSEGFELVAQGDTARVYRITACD